MEPPLADHGPRYKQRPCRLAVYELQAMRCHCAPQYRPPPVPDECPAWRDFAICTFDDDAAIDPGVIVQRAVVVAAPDLVQVDVAPALCGINHQRRRYGALLGPIKKTGGHMHGVQGVPSSNLGAQTNTYEHPEISLWSPLWSPFRSGSTSGSQYGVYASLACGCDSDAYQGVIGTCRRVEDAVNRESAWLHRCTGANQNAAVSRDRPP